MLLRHLVKLLMHFPRLKCQKAKHRALPILYHLVKQVLLRQLQFCPAKALARSQHLPTKQVLHPQI